jgi:hypothetical protein
MAQMSDMLTGSLEISWMTVLGGELFLRGLMMGMVCDMRLTVRHACNVWM